MRFNSLSVKIIGFFTMTVALVVGILIGLIYYNFREIFKSQLTEKGKQLAEFFNQHSSITYGFMQEDKFLLSEVISLFLRDKDVIFAAVVKKDGEIMAYKSKDPKIDEDLIWFIRNLVVKRVIHGAEDMAMGNIVEKKTITGDEVIIFLLPVRLERTDIPLLGMMEEEGTKKKEKILKGFTVLTVTLRNFELEFRKKIINIISLIGILGFAALLFSAILLRGNLKPLSRMREISEKISKEGDLREKPHIHSMDEIGEIAASFSRMIDILKAEIQGIKNTSNRLSRISRELIKTMDRIKQSSHTQDEEIGKIANSIEDIHERAYEIAGMVDEVNKIMGKVSEDATRSEFEIGEIRRNLEDVAAKMDEITSKIFLVKKRFDDLTKIRVSENANDIMASINLLKNSIKELSDEVMQINTTIENISQASEHLSDEMQNIEDGISSISNEKDKVVKKLERMQTYINDIMEEVFELLDSIDDTNMLAINAHIIASHAGEQGKEFGIVAQEIQQLSQDTEEKVKSIKEVLMKLEEELVFSTEILSGQMEETLRTVNNSKKQLSESINKVKGNADETKSKFRSVKPSIERISEVSTKLDNSFKHLFDDIKKISGIIENSESMVTSSADEIKDIKIQLSKIIETLNNLTELAKRFTQRANDSTETLSNINNEANKQYQKVDDVRKSIANLENAINEVIKIVLMSHANVEAISKLARKLDEMIKRFKT